jgi:hypothetical protein
MKKILLISLLVIALPLYGYNVFLLLRVALPAHGGGSGVSDQGNAPSFESVLLAAAPVVFEEKGKDPFQLYKKKPKPVAPVNKPRKKPKTVKKEVAAPAITITGIMWNPDNPIAMVKLPGGKSAVAKKGQQLSDNLTVKKVEKKSITVVFEGKEFTYERK